MRVSRFAQLSSSRVPSSPAEGAKLTAAPPTMFTCASSTAPNLDASTLLLAVALLGEYS
jgi:hypothetical protein